MRFFLNKNKQELFLKTTLWNTIIETYKQEKNMDISNYLVSIKVLGNVLFVKTNNPIVNEELLNINEKIKESFYKKIKNLENLILDFEIKYK